MRSVVGLLLCAGIGCIGCTPHKAELPLCSQGTLQLELRDAEGALSWSVRDLGMGHPPSGTAANPSDATAARQLLLCDASAHAHGWLWLRPAAHRVGWLDSGGRWRVELDGVPPDVAGTALGKPYLRMHDDGQLVHVLDGQGVPFGSFGSDQHGAMMVYDRASVLTLRVEQRGQDASLTRAADGAVRGYISGRSEAVRLRAAPIFGLPLPAEEQLALYYAW